MTNDGQESISKGVVEMARDPSRANDEMLHRNPSQSSRGDKNMGSNAKYLEQMKHDSSKHSKKIALSRGDPAAALMAISESEANELVQQYGESQIFNQQLNHIHHDLGGRRSPFKEPSANTTLLGNRKSEMFNIQNQEPTQHDLNQQVDGSRLGNHYDLLSGDVDTNSPNQDLRQYGGSGKEGEVYLHVVSNDDELQTPTRRSPGIRQPHAPQQVQSSEVMNSGSDTTGYFRHLSTLNDHQVG